MSPGAIVQRSPMPVAASASTSARRPAMTTVAPAACSSSAARRPRFVPPPVTSTTRPSSSPAAKISLAFVTAGAIYTRRMPRRLIGVALVAVGGLLLLDAILTLTWREPVSWLASRGDQPRLDARLRVVDRRLTRALDGRMAQLDARRRMALAARTLERASGDGDPLGRISIPAIGARFVVVQGTAPADLRGGPGHYRPTALPGERGTVGLAGHRTTHQQPFRSIDALKPGDRIVMTMPYGRFAYRVTGSRVVAPSAVGVLARPAAGGAERLVLTACHPLYSAAQRLVVSGTLVDAQPLGAAA